MQLTGHITPDNLMSLEAYSKFRKTHKTEVIAHRRLRSVTADGSPSTTTPEPSSLVLMAAGLASLGYVGRGRRKA